MQTEAARPETKFESIPENPWYLRNDETGGLVPAFDCAGDPLLVYRDEGDALEGAIAHKRLYDLNCTPVSANT